MKVTVIPPDRFVSVDGEGRHFDFPADPSIEAIQWDGDSMVGHVQRRNGAAPFTDPRVVQPFVDAWQAEKDRIAALARPAPPPPDLRTVHPFYFRLRFTQAQRTAFDTSVDPALVELRAQFTSADTIGLDDPRTAAGLDLMIAKSIIAAGDKAALLADRKPGEKP